MTGPIVALFAEDEPIIQIAIEEALEEGGYAVLLAGSGLDAEALLESRHGELRALVTDIRLGSGPDGWELARRARELNGQIAGVLTRRARHPRRAGPPAMPATKLKIQ